MTFTESELPPYRRRECCGKPSRSVFFSGNVHGLSNQDIEAWLRSIDSPPFVHVFKKDDVGWVVL